MQKQIHKNFIKSSNLIFGTVGLGVINIFLSDEVRSSGTSVAIGVINLILIAGIGLVVRKGRSWIKYLLLILTIFGVIGILSLSTI